MEVELREFGRYPGATFRNPVPFSFFRIQRRYAAENTAWWDLENFLVPRHVEPSEMYDHIKSGLICKGFTGPLQIHAVSDNTVRGANGIVIDEKTLTGISYHRIPGSKFF